MKVAIELDEARFKDIQRIAEVQTERRFQTAEQIIAKGAPIKQGPCEDAISRQATLDAMYALCDAGETLKENPWRDNPHMDAIIDTIENLPSVTPQQKVGKWNSRFTEIKGNNTFNCMECGSTFIVEQGAYNMNYCPNCGQPKMESKEP